MKRKAVRLIDLEAPVKIRSIQAWEYSLTRTSTK
jgi:hypothetical protein